MEEERLIVGLAVICAVVWLVAAIHPLDPQAWWLENLLLGFFIAVIGLADGCAENHHQHRPGLVAGMEQKCHARQIPNLARR